MQRGELCRSCPFRLKRKDYWFEPEVLERTIGRNIENGYIHDCHSDSSFFCTGYLVFVENTIGLEALNMGRMGLRLKVLNKTKIPKIKTFQSWKALINSHRRAARRVISSG